MMMMMMMMMIPPTLILNGMNSLCRLCLGAPIYFNRMCNIIVFCMPANTILSTVFPSAVVRFSLSPLMYPPSVLLLCLSVSVFLSFFLNS